jgi:hypothetical protein
MSVLGQTGSPPQWQERIAAGPHVRHRDIIEDIIEERIAGLRAMRGAR